MSKAWFDFSYVQVVLVKGHPKFKTSKLLHIIPGNQVQIVKNGDYRSSTLFRSQKGLTVRCYSVCCDGQVIAEDHCEFEESTDKEG